MSTIIHDGIYYKIPNKCTVNVCSNGDMLVNSRKLEEYPTVTVGTFLSDGFGEAWTYFLLGTMGIILCAYTVVKIW